MVVVVQTRLPKWSRPIGRVFKLINFHYFNIIELDISHVFIILFAILITFTLYNN